MPYTGDVNHKTTVGALAAQAVLDARRRAGLTQGELARRIGSDQKDVWRLESGRHNTTIETLEKVATALGGLLEISISQPAKRLAPVARTLKRGEESGTGEELLRYWLARPAAERVEASLKLRRDAYRSVTGRELPRIADAARVIERKRP